MRPQKKAKAKAGPKPKPRTAPTAKGKAKAKAGPKPKPRTALAAKGKPKAKAAPKSSAKVKATAALRAKAAAKPKATTKAKVAAKAKAAPAPKVKGKQQVRRKLRRVTRRQPVWMASVAVGDAVRIPPEAHEPVAVEQMLGQEARRREAIEGIVCSIREIATGRLVPRSSGKLSDYLLELVHTETFRLHYGSDRNTGGPRGPEDVRENPTWQRLRRALREMAGGKRLVTISGSGMSEEPLRSLLDGWRVVKVKARQAEAIA